MCVKTIIDASAFRHLIEETPNSAGHQMCQWILRGDGLVVYSSGKNKYAEELRGYNEILQLIGDFTQRGRTEDVSDEHLSTVYDTIPSRPIRKSDDPHVLALAKVSGATVLFAHEPKLCIDFANVEVLSKVRRTERRSVPNVALTPPTDISGSKARRLFLNKRRCRSKRR